MVLAGRYNFPVFYLDKTVVGFSLSLTVYPSASSILYMDGSISAEKELPYVLESST